MSSCTKVREPAQQHWPWLKNRAKWACSTAQSTAEAEGNHEKRIRSSLAPVAATLNPLTLPTAFVPAGCQTLCGNKAGPIAPFSECGDQVADRHEGEWSSPTVVMEPRAAGGPNQLAYGHQGRLPQGGRIWEHLSRTRKKDVMEEK